LQLNTTKVTAALTANPDAVRSLLTGKASFTQATGFTHMSSNSLTKAGTYGVEITSLPSKAVLNGGTITAGGPDISGLSAANRAMSLNIDGQTINITMAPNAYSTYNFFSQGLQADINAQLPADKQITVAYNGGSNRFDFTSSKTGSTSKVQIISSGAGLSVFGLAPATATGTGLAGKIGGAVALADDASMTLIGATGNGAAGLKIKVDATQTVGLHGSVSFATGVAYNLDKRVAGLVKSNGAVDSRTAGINAQIKMIGDRRDVLNTRMTMIESTMRKQFNGMDASVAKYTALNSYVAQQMTALAKSSGLA
jgi:flagellar hook-associated protein 2